MDIFGIGMDTSKYQASKVDYKKAAGRGYGFVILRIGYKNTKDSCFEKDYNRAVEAGLKVGVYFYTMSKTDTEAAADATRVLGWLNGRKLDLPIYYDVEDKIHASAARKAANTSMYNAFMKKITADGYSCGLYTGEYFANHYMDIAATSGSLWIAKYSNTAPKVNRTIDIWQYTSDAIDMDYYKGKLDRNYLLVKDICVAREETSFKTKNIYPEPKRTLRKNIILMKGDDVKWLQYELRTRGYNIVIDGVFGNATLAAVRSFQENSGKGLKVDGIVGPATRYALKNR